MTAPKIKALRDRGQKIVCVTAYDSAFGALADEAGVDIVLVGDSVGNVMLGHKTTVPVDLADMIHHTRAVSGSVTRALLVADLPFGSYQSSVAQAVDSAVALMKAGAEAVKLEGEYLECIEAIARAGIPVMGHVGMTPQSIHLFGGHRVQGKGDNAEIVLDAAHRVANAGAFAIVLELIPAALAKRVTDEVDCVTIGIGAGADCHGQIQVLHDVLGLAPSSFRHAKGYLNGRELVIDALRAYAEEVRTAQFPGGEHSFADR